MEHRKKVLDYVLHVTNKLKIVKSFVKPFVFTVTAVMSEESYVMWI